VRYDSRDTDRDDAWDRDAAGRATRTASTPAHDDRLAAARQPNVPTDHLRLPTGRLRERVVTAEDRYRLRGSQSHTLAILGTFRVVRADELPHYGADTKTRDRDIRTLKRQDLITAHVHHTRGGARYEVLTLTDRGAALLHCATRDDRGQHYHAGLVKRRELPHDLALYRMYRQEAGRLEAEGARIKRVIIDAEIKRAYQQLVNARAQEHGNARRGRDQAREEFAAAQQLPILDGRLQIPDMRLEYETPDGELRHVDLELTTEHYRKEHIAAKHRAGFVIYRAANPRAGHTARGATPDDTESDLERLL
jgi:hypothetical protein